MLVSIAFFFFPPFSWKLVRLKITGAKVLSCLDIADVEGKSQLSNEVEQEGLARWWLRRQAAWASVHSVINSSSPPGPSRSYCERDAVCPGVLKGCAHHLCPQRLMPDQFPLPGARLQVQPRKAEFDQV